MIETNRSVAQIRSYVVNNVFPDFRSRLTFHFSGFVGGIPTVTMENTDNITRQPESPNRYEVWARLEFTLDVTAETADDARTRYFNFLEDMKDRLRTMFQNISASTTVISMHYHRESDDTTVETTF